jgi:hypothetical protein
LAEQIAAEDGAVPDQFVDRALDLAVDFLAEKLEEPESPNR